MVNVEPPSGEQYEIVSGAARAMIVEVGGGVRSFTVGDRPVAAAYDLQAMRPKGAGSILVPWPNRLADGRYRHAGVDHQLPLTEPENHNAIHGLLRWERWEVTDKSEDHVTLRYDLVPQTGYPFALAVQVRWTVGPDGLRADHSVRNTGDRAAPFGLGVHPYVDLAGTPFGDTTVRLDARRRLLVDERGLPIKAELIGGTHYDLAGGGPLGELRLDTAYTDLERDGADVATVRIGRSDGTAVQVWMDRSFGYVELYTAAAFDGRTDAIAVEPMSCAPNAFNLRAGLVVLQPTVTWAGSWGMRLT
ncbi:MAG: aldose 1-epimerase family protein [Mycobacteriales bacterium]